MLQTRNTTLVMWATVSLVAATAATGQEITGDARRAEALAERALPLRLDADSPGRRQLAATIGDARIVLLGEPWHGDGAAIRLKAELVRWLHSEMGFDVLILESDFYAVTKGWLDLESPEDVAPFAAASFYPFWSTAAAARPLWEYVAEEFDGPRPLRIAGVDVRHIGSLSAEELPARIDSILVDAAGVSMERRRRFRRQLELFLAAENPETPSEGVRREFHAVLDELDRHMEYAESVDPLLHREIRNLRAAAEYAWQGANRDALMGENFRWSAGQLYPEAKLIVWAHNNHLIEDKWMYFAAPDSAIRSRLKGRSAGSIGAVTYLGDEIRQFAGPGVVTFATLTGTGEYTPDISRTAIEAAGQGQDENVAPRRPPENTLEAALTDRGLDVAIVPLETLEPGGDVAFTQALDYTVAPPRLMAWNVGYDAFLFVRETFPVTESPPSPLRGN